MYPNLFQAIDQFLREPAQIEAMQQASDRGRPALEGIDAAFLRAFGPAYEDKTKQEIGRHVKAVMHANGYELIPNSQTDCRGTRVFASGSCYRRAAR
jgi:hypothetical protein